MKVKLLVMLLVFILGLRSACLAQSGPEATFDFDTGSPPLSTYESLPVDQTSGGIQAQFRSLSGDFSVQTAESLGNWTLSQFSGQFLVASTAGSVLQVKFSQPVTSVSVKFATADFPPIEVPTFLELAAFLGSTNTPVGQPVTARGNYGTDTVPMSTISLRSATPFNLVRLRIAPKQAPGAQNFMVDTVVVSVAPRLRISRANSSVLVAWPSSWPGYALQTVTDLFPGSWTAMTNTVKVVGNENQVEISPTLAHTFYRLALP